jgi:hypothetical protein
MLKLLCEKIEFKHKNNMINNIDDIRLFKHKNSNIRIEQFKQFKHTNCYMNNIRIEQFTQFKRTNLSNLSY